MKRSVLVLVVVAVIVLTGCEIVPIDGRWVVRFPTLRVRPRLVAIHDTGIRYAPDVEQDIFYYQNQWYWYTDGAWYISARHKGPWSVVTTIPVAFQRIPTGHPRYYVVGRYSPGTWTARPHLEFIPGAGIYFASNLATDMYLFGGVWYWCSKSVWYRSSSDHNGPWVRVEAAPAAFGRIPRSHPRYRAVRSARTSRSAAKKLRDKRAPKPPPRHAPAPKPRRKGQIDKLRKKKAPAPRHGARPATPATPAIPGVRPAIPARPATPARPAIPGVRPAIPARPAAPKRGATPPMSPKRALPPTRGKKVSPPAPPPPVKKVGKKDDDEEKKKKKLEEARRREAQKRREEARKRRERIHK